MAMVRRHPLTALIFNLDAEVAADSNNVFYSWMTDRENFSNRTFIEDCLEKVPNRFALVVLAAERARQIARGAVPLVDCDNKPAVCSLREIAAGMVEFRENVKEVVVEYIEERRKAGFM